MKIAHTYACNEQFYSRLKGQLRFAHKWPHFCRSCFGWGFYFKGIDRRYPFSHIGPVTPCPDCVAKGLCPRCGEALDEKREYCAACGWHAGHAGSEGPAVSERDCGCWRFQGEGNESRFQPPVSNLEEPTIDLSKCKIHPSDWPLFYYDGDRSGLAAVMDDISYLG